MSTSTLNKYVVKNDEDDVTEINKALVAQKQFDKRAFLEFKNEIDKQFEDQEQTYRINNKLQEMRIQCRVPEENKIMLFTPDGKIIRGFKDIEGIYDLSETNLGFIVASWIGYFTGMKGYDPDHGTHFQRSINQKQIKEGIEKLQNDWEIKRNEHSYSYKDNKDHNDSATDQVREKTLYIWRNESYRYRFQQKLGPMNPVHLHNSSSNEVRKDDNYILIPIESKPDIQSNQTTPKGKKQFYLEDENSKSHASMVQATAKDILSFENI